MIWFPLEGTVWPLDTEAVREASRVVGGLGLESESSTSGLALSLTDGDAFCLFRGAGARFLGTAVSRWSESSRLRRLNTVPVWDRVSGRWVDEDGFVEGLVPSSSE